MGLKHVDAFIFEIRRVIENDVSKKNVVINSFKDCGYELNNRLTMENNLLQGKIKDIPTECLIRIAKNLEIKNYQEYFEPDNQLEISEVMSLVVDIQEDVRKLIERIKDLEKKVGK